MKYCSFQLSPFDVRIYASVLATPLLHKMKKGESEDSQMESFITVYSFDITYANRKDTCITDARTRVSIQLGVSMDAQ